MTSISDTINRHINDIVNNRMREITDEMKIRRAVENSMHFVVTGVFSAHAIGQAAGKLDGDRARALQVIAAAFRAMDPERSEENSGERPCERCNAPIGFTITGFSLFPARVVCPNCGVMDDTEAAA